MIQAEIDIAATKRAELTQPPIETKDIEPMLAEETVTEQEVSALDDHEKTKVEVNDTEIRDILEELVPSGATIE